MFNFVNDEEKSFFGGFFLLHAGIAVIILSVSAAIWLGSRAAVLFLAFIAICLGIGYCDAVTTVRNLEGKQSGQVR